MTESLRILLEESVTARESLFDPQHRAAFRMFNGFTEGFPDLAIDLYATTLVFHDYAGTPEQGAAHVEEARSYLQERLPWLQAGVVKTRNGSAEMRRGRILFGSPDDRMEEGGVWYALDLCLNRDASLYLDTRLLRQWALHELAGRTVLNTFAYTGSLGVAALAGGASRVVQLDRTRQFLNLAKTSYTLNGFPIRKADFLTGDFFEEVGRLKREGERFDCVFVDPPFFSTGGKGRVDLNRDSTRLLNKVRPLINDQGWLVAINNALFVSGKEVITALETLCADGYLKLVELIPVPPDFSGYPETYHGAPLVDPAPFNHSTKIAVLEVRRKSG